MTPFSLVVPTIGRPSLGHLLASLAPLEASRPHAIVLVDDRRDGGPLHLQDLDGDLMRLIRVVRSGGRGPAAARNVGWRSSVGDWIVFLDDDVQVGPQWWSALPDDLDVPADVAGVQARIEVPLPSTRRPTDWERNTAGLADAAWITADMAYRRVVLDEVGGFDERFPRAFREDADLALRVLDHGYRLERGRRVTRHPVRPAPWSISVSQQRGNADDALMRVLHGRDWRRRAAAPAGARPWHITTALAAMIATTGLVTRHRRTAVTGGLAWTALSLRFAATRIAAGPRTLREIAVMAVTSALIPPVAVAHWLRGTVCHRHADQKIDTRSSTDVRAVLLDRDGTLIHDVPYNGDPDRVEPMPEARAALERLRQAGLKLAVVSNQSGIGRGLIGIEDVTAVNRRVEDLLGPFDDWEICPHDVRAGCSCRKPRPALLHRAARTLGVRIDACVVIGDIGADLAAAADAGAAAAALIPTPATRRREVRRAAWVEPDLNHAVEKILTSFASPRLAVATGADS
ncbi:MAG: HAD-IIIA family hydrolase [Actinobacteria bacterium]|nr:HAD-IIIA family hydrolase [Actinomycetota bacterium]